MQEAQGLFTIKDNFYNQVPKLFQKLIWTFKFTVLRLNLQFAVCKYIPPKIFCRRALSKISVTIPKNKSKMSGTIPVPQIAQFHRTPTLRSGQGRYLQHARQHRSSQGIGAGMGGVSTKFRARELRATDGSRARQLQ